MNFRRIFAKVAALALLTAAIPLVSCASDGSQSRDEKTQKGVSNTSFKELKSEKGLPVVVDFYADWCGPCAEFRPTFHAAEKAYSGKVEFKTVNVDEKIELAESLGISQIPTILFITKDGREAKRFTGIMSEEELHKAVDALLAN